MGKQVTKTTFIYALIDPVTKRTRYIGKADNPEKRLERHMKFFEPKPTYKQNWLKSLAAKGQIPSLEILEEVSVDNWKKREQEWIQYHWNIGSPLTNIANGGNGGWTRLSEEGRRSRSEKARQRMQSMWDSIRADYATNIRDDDETIDTGYGMQYNNR